MAKFVQVVDNVLVTVVSSRNSAVGYFTFAGKYYSSKITGKVITPEDIQGLLESAIQMVEQLTGSKLHPKVVKI